MPETVHDIATEIAETEETIPTFEAVMTVIAEQSKTTRRKRIETTQKVSASSSGLGSDEARMARDKFVNETREAARAAYREAIDSDKTDMSQLVEVVQDVIHQACEARHAS